MKLTQLFTGVVVVAAVILAVSYYCGAQTGRWGAFTGLEDCQQSLRSVPMQIGDWLAEKEYELEKSAVAELQIQNGYINRTYKNTKTQAVVYITIIVGPTGRVTVHTPEICFGGRDYEREGDRKNVSVPVAAAAGAEPANDNFWMVSFTNKAIGGLESGKITFYYAIGLGKEWVAVENPRYMFRKNRYAYKLQAEASVSGDADNVKDFLQDCLPVIHQHLKECR